MDALHLPTIVTILVHITPPLNGRKPALCAFESENPLSKDNLAANHYDDLTRALQGSSMGRVLPDLELHCNLGTHNPAPRRILSSLRTHCERASSTKMPMYDEEHGQIPASSDALKDLATNLSKA